jgi:hypothetical protein
MWKTIKVKLDKEMELTSVLNILRETRYFIKYALVTPEISYRIKHSAQNLINLESGDEEFDDQLSIESNLRQKIEDRIAYKAHFLDLEEEGSIEPKSSCSEEEEEEEFSEGYEDDSQYSMGS